MKPAISAADSDGPKYTVKSVYVLRPDGRDHLTLSGKTLTLLPLKREHVQDLTVQGGLVKAVLTDGRLITFPLTICIVEHVPEPSA